MSKRDRRELKIIVKNMKNYKGIIKMLDCWGMDYTLIKEEDNIKINVHSMYIINIDYNDKRSIEYENV